MKTIPHIKELKNILILRGEGSLGDAVLSSCAYREIKKANPSIRITVAAYGAALGYLKQIPYIDDVVALPIRRVIRRHQRWPSLIKAGLALRKRHFDLVVDSSAKNFYNWRLFKWLCGGKNRVLDFAHAPGVYGASGVHASRHEQAILTQLGVPEPDASYCLPIPSETEQKINAFTADFAPQGYILLNPFGSIAMRTLNVQTCRRIMEYWNQAGWCVLVPCMPSQRAAAEDIVRPFPAGKNTVFQTADVFDLFALVRGSAAVVTPDTAVVHIAAGFVKPTVAFYNSYSVYNEPNNPQARVVKTAKTDINQFNWADFEKSAEEVKSLL